MNDTEIEVQRTLVLSTAHLRKETAERMDAEANAGNAHPHEGHQIDDAHFDAIGYGYLVWVPSADEQSEGSSSDGPGEILQAMILARQNDCRYIRYDSSGPQVEHLPTYEW
jgi:hypothetical protein